MIDWKFARVGFVLVLVLAGAALEIRNARADGAIVSPDPIENAARKEFSMRMGTFYRAGNWRALLQQGREWQKSHPTDGNGWLIEARGAYLLGDVETAVAAWKRAMEVEPEMAPEAQSWLLEARKLRENFPTLQLKPLQWENGDSAEQIAKWEAKGRALMAAQKWDEIEKTAAQLQVSQTAAVDGTPDLSAFFDGVCEQKPNFATHARRIAAWLKAKPASPLARAAQIELWTDEAWRARGNGFADSITPEGTKRMDECLGRAAALVEALMLKPAKNSFDSPLIFRTLLNWGQLAGIGREGLDAIYAQASQLFPNYQSLHSVRANALLPRWYGEEGEWEQWAKTRADGLKGEAGDIFYARIVMRLAENHGNIFDETKADYPRATRGLEALLARNPNSVSVSSILLKTAIWKKDWKRAQKVLASPIGHRLASFWWKDEKKLKFPEFRMEILAK